MPAERERGNLVAPLGSSVVVGPLYRARLVVIRITPLAPREP
jgi:hypothetical protein